jgi:hypothetical protein
LRPFRLVLMAWAGAIVATASGLLYLEYAPVPDSLAADRLLVIGVCLVGGVMGATAARRLANLVSARRREAKTLRRPREAESLERSAA